MTDTPNPTDPVPEAITSEREQIADSIRCYHRSFRRNYPGGHSYFRHEGEYAAADAIIARRLASQDAGEGLREALERRRRVEDNDDSRAFNRGLDAALSIVATPLSDAGSTTRSGGEGGSRVCRICDGGPGNECACLCGLRAWEQPRPAAISSPDIREGVRGADRTLVADILDEVSSLLQHDGIGAVADLIRDGEYDEHEAVAIAVRHRLATTPSPDASPDSGEAERIGLAVADLVERHLTSPAMIWGLPKLPESWMTELRSVLVASLEAELAASPASLSGGAEDRKAARIAEMIDEGGAWRACSGCQEGEDGYVSARDYPYSAVYRCQPGGGCTECGGIGVIWEPPGFWEGYGEDASSPEAPANRQEGGEVAPDEEWLTDVIDDSLDMDWTGRVGARAIIARWSERHD